MISKRLRGKAIARNLAYGAAQYARNMISYSQEPYRTLYRLAKPVAKDFLDGSFTFTLVDEASKININKAPLEVLMLLPGIEEDVARNIIEARSVPFVLGEELLLVEGVNQEIFSLIRDLITVYSEGAVNINTASSDVLEFLGCDEDLAGIIQRFRAGPDGIEATEDDPIFENAGTIISDLRSSTPLFQAQEATLLSLVSQGFLGVDSGHYTVIIETNVYGVREEYRVTINKGRIVRWNEAPL